MILGEFRLHQRFFCLDRRWSAYRAACVDAGCEQSKHPHASGGRTIHACHAPDGANRGERRYRAGLRPDCQRASGNRPQAHRGNGRPGLCPRCEGCSRRSRPQRDAKIETQPRLARHGKFDGLTDSPEDVASGNTAGVAFVNRRPQRGELRLI